MEQRTLTQLSHPRKKTDSKLVSKKRMGQKWSQMKWWGRDQEKQILTKHTKLKKKKKCKRKSGDRTRTNEKTHTEIPKIQ